MAKAIVSLGGEIRLLDRDRKFWYKHDMGSSPAVVPVPFARGVRIQRSYEGKHDPRRSRHVSLPGHYYVHLYGYKADLWLNGRRFRVRPGSAGIISPDTRVRYRRYGPSTHLFAHFAPLDPSSEPIPIAVVQDLGERLVSISERFESMIRFFPSQPARAEARLCDLLWDLACPPAAPAAPWEAAGNPLVRRACQFIEQVLDRPLTVALIAEHCGVGSDHLARLFRQHLQETVLAHLRHRRAQRARHLLLHSSLPMKTIAQQVGIPDPHFFNKTIRRQLGAAPTEIRAMGSDLPATTAPIPKRSARTR